MDSELIRKAAKAIYEKYNQDCAVPMFGSMTEISKRPWDAVAQAALKVFQEHIAAQRPQLDGRAIMVWRYEQAPEILQAVGSSDDADWLAWVPPGQQIPEWATVGKFGICNVKDFNLPNGATVLIGYHA
jgi:hypothetical protein